MTDWLLGTMLATSGLVVLVLLIREPVRRHFGSRVAYGLWLIPAARLLMPTLTQTVERNVPVPSAVEPLATAVSVEPMLLASVTPPQATLIDQLGGWPTILLALWIGGGLGLFVGRMVAFHRERQAILADAAEIGRIDSIRIVRSPDVSGPLAFGIFDRVIAVPAEFELLFGERERRLALEHEIAHHRSGDLVANFFAFVLLCLQWFNPLAWVAHAAFRFDQEAACDARVLDKVEADDRADYCRAIAKAASGRALLFASALDRRKTLHRRLKSMLTIPSSGRRLTGRVIVLATVAVALPLTATRAIDYVDVPVASAAQAVATPVTAAAAAVSQAVQPVAPVAPVQPAVPLAPAPPAAPDYYKGQLNIRGDLITINGQTKRWEELTPAEKQQVRRDLARAKQELAGAHIDRAEIERDIREAMADFKIDREELARNIGDARVEIEQAMRQIDANAAHLRRTGQDPEAIKAQVRASLKSVEAIDVEAITRQAMASVNPATIAASVAAAEASIAKAQAEIERLEERFDQVDDE